MTMDPNQPSRPKHFSPRRGDRRRVNALKGVPLAGGLGLVFHERRSHRERRRTRGNIDQSPPCALLRLEAEKPRTRGFFRSMSSRWSGTAIGAWIRNRLKDPWRR
jgi:hypothetical protein